MKKTTQHRYFPILLLVTCFNFHPKKMGGHVYIMCSRNHTTLYTGVTSNLAARVVQHKTSAYPGSFTFRYHCVKLVWYQWFDTIIDAIAEEKRIKAGNRKSKEALIHSKNPYWKDLYEEVKSW